MKLHIYIDDNNYLSGWSKVLQRKVLVDEKAEEPFEYIDVETPEGAILLEIDDNHPFLNLDNGPMEAWKYVDGDLVFDEEKQQQLADEYEREQNKPTEIERLEDALLELAMMTMNGE